MRTVIYTREGITITQEDVLTTIGAIVQMITIQDAMGNLVRMDEVKFRDILTRLTDSAGIPTY